MGSPIAFSHAGQVFASHMVLDYYAKLARSFPFEEPREAMIGSTLVRQEPVGVAAAIVPWNVPLFTTLLKLAPALAAGATVGGEAGARDAARRRAARRGARRGVDLDAALPQLLGAATMNNGQACVAQTRILAPRSRYAECVEALAAAVGAMKVGDPLDPATAIGPLVAERQRDRVLGYVDAGKREGARLVAGGGRPAGLDRGWYVAPTLFADVDHAMTIAREEIFGPVLAAIPYDDDADAVRIANDSD